MRTSSCYSMGIAKPVSCPSPKPINKGVKLKEGEEDFTLNNNDDNGRKVLLKWLLNDAFTTFQLACPGSNTGTFY